MPEMGTRDGSPEATDRVSTADGDLHAEGKASKAEVRREAETPMSNPLQFDVPRHLKPDLTQDPGPILGTCLAI